MKTLAIYDNTGYIYLLQGGTYRTPEGGMNYLITEIPEGKMIKGIDISVTPNQPVFEDIPLTETELLKKRVEEQEAALIELASLVGGNA